MWKIDTNGGKQKSVALLVVDLVIWWRHSLKINKCRNFETNQNIRISPRQICIKLPKVSFKQFNRKKNATEFYIHHFKYLSSMLFFPVEIGDYLQKAPLENLQKRMKQQARFTFVLFPNFNDTWMLSCIYSYGRIGSPWISYSY